MLDGAERAYLEAARVARLATADARGRPAVVPICFGLADGVIVTPIDEKPKERSPSALRRVRDVRENPRVAVVVDHYVEDWSRLGWLQVRGTASVVEPDPPEGDGDLDPDPDPDAPVAHRDAVDSLRAKYDQYTDHDLESRPIISIEPGSTRSWGRLERHPDP